MELNKEIINYINDGDYVSFNQEISNYVKDVLQQKLNNLQDQVKEEIFGDNVSQVQNDLDIPDDYFDEDDLYMEEISDDFFKKEAEEVE